MPKYKLTYFDLPGYGEPIRWMLSILGDQFEDRRMSREEWPSVKPTTPFGKVPILEFDGQVVAQTTAICRYLGRKAKMAGEDEWEALQIDMVVDVLHDVRQALASARYETDEETKTKKLEELNKETLPFYFGKLDDRVKKNNGYLANGKLSWGDVFFVALFGSVKEAVGYDLTGNHQNLKRLNDTILSLPQIKKWNESHNKAIGDVRSRDDDPREHGDGRRQPKQPPLGSACVAEAVYMCGSAGSATPVPFEIGTKMEDKPETMVLVRDAVKTFRSRRVLRSLSLSVKKQALYGLLGPSSCGKTTLLNCILAVRRLDSGFINLKLRCSRDIGYMPQELALFENFTMRETFHFYGNFFGMEEKKINKRMFELVEFLGLPECAARPIATFSGGQKRRVSFAVALFQDPTLLILDEPTVGMDCVLSERIWSYLLKLTTEGKTIIITTHYIQEAKNCDVIGLMRHGQLLVEKSPHQLMALHQSTNLEEIFLDVCKKQDGLQDAIDLQDKIFEEKKKSSKASYRLFPDNNWFDAYRFLALLNKNVLWLRRNKLAASGTAILPLIIVFLYGMVMGKDPKSLKIALLSQEISYDGDLRICNGLPQSYFEALNCTLPSLFTCPFIEELHKRDLNIVLYKDYSYIARDIASNKVWGSIEVPQNFTSALINRIENGLRTEDKIVEDGIMTSRIDGTNAIIKIILTNHLKESMENFYNNILLSCGMSEKARIIPLQYNDPLFGLKESAFDQSALPGFLSAFAFYFTLIYTTSAIMMEKVLGLLDRNTAAGMTYFEIVAAHLVVQFVIMLMQNTIMLVVFYVIFGYNFEGSIGLAMFILVTVNCVGISFAFLLTEIFDKELSTAYASIGATVTVFMTGGIIWPQEGMHYMLALLSSVIPVAPVTKGLISIIARDYAITHPSILAGLFSNLIWTIVFTILAYIVRRINKVM